MIVTHLSLTDYRNYAEAEVDFEPGPNLFVGSNGQGKTNLVESIVYLGALSSHRVAGDQPLIRAGADSGVVRARLAHGDRTVLVELQLNRNGSNRAQLNRGPIKPRELPRHVQSVIFAPEDLALVKGEPSGRRALLDQLLIQTSPRFAGTLGDYDRTLRQRNQLLKSGRSARLSESALATLDVWDEKLVGFGTEIIVGRGNLVDRLAPHVSRAYREVAGEAQQAELSLRLSIFGASDDEDDPVAAATEAPRDAEQVAIAFRAALSERRRAELDRGLSLVGPHRDDLVLTLNGLPARGYASHGESWSFALSLRLGSAALLREGSPLGDPIVILDDVFAELDQTRRAKLASAVRDYEQVLITAAVAEDVPAELAGRTVRIQAGRVLGVDE